MNKIVQTLKQIQADSAVFYIKLHNYHWNVKGADFHPVHSALENMYDEITEQMDEVAAAKSESSLKDFRKYS